MHSESASIPNNNDGTDGDCVSRINSLEKSFEQSSLERSNTNRKILIQRLQEFCQKRGLSGLKALGVIFRRMDHNFDNHLSLREFAAGLKAFQVHFCDQDIEQLFAHFDKNNDKQIDFLEFLEELRPPLSVKRQRIIDRVFDCIDKNNDGVVEVADLVERYQKHAQRHPKFQTGEWSVEQVLQDFLSTFDSEDSPDGKITREEFVDYYAAVSATIPSDEYFDLVMRNSWDVQLNRPPQPKKALSGHM